jgi:polyisoprenoid-binding protein YceI
MGVHAGRHQLGPDRGRILLRTYRDGLAARAGHDLTIEVSRWSGELTIAGDLSPAALQVRIDMTSLTVLEGHGGLSPLTDRDRREIAVTAGKVLETRRYPEARFEAATFEQAPGGGVISGTLTLHGRSGPLRLEVHDKGDGHYQASGSVTQSGYGIRPYTGFLGALRVRDAVDVSVDVTLPAPGQQTGDGT